MDTLVINLVGREKRYALLKEKRPEKIVINQPKHESLVGGIYVGTVTKVHPGMNAVFIDIGEEKNGYLHRDKIPAYVLSAEKIKGEQKNISSYIHQGEKLLVQVEKDATGNKGPRLTGIIEFNGQALVYMPKGGYVAVSRKIEEDATREKWRQFGLDVKTSDEGLLFRTAVINYTEAEIKSELTRLRENYEMLVQITQTMKNPGLVYETNSFIEEIIAEMQKMTAGKVIVDDQEIKHQLTKANENEHIQIDYFAQKENIFSSYRLDHEIEKALNRIVWLENGAYLIFDEAEALTVIDVNTGKYAGKHDIQETVMKTNEWAAIEIARQIRLRDIGGMILVDFIDMKHEIDRTRIVKTMEKSLQMDEKRTRIIGFTPLGILQITRKRTRVSILEALTNKCTVCEGTGRILSADSVAFQLERELWEHRTNDYEAVLIETTREVQSIFSGEQNIHKQRLEEAFGMQFYFLLKEAPKPYYLIRQFGEVGEIEAKANDC